MIIAKEHLLIASTPGQILLGLSLIIAFAAVSLLCLNVEQYLCPGLRAWWCDLLKFLHRRWRRRRWVYYAFGGTRDLSHMKSPLKRDTAQRPSPHDG